MPTAAITSAVAAKIANSSMLKRRCEMLSSTTWSMAYTSCTGWSLSIAPTGAVTADVMRSGSPAVRTISARLGNWLRDGKNISGRGGLSRPSWRVSATTPITTRRQGGRTAVDPRMEHLTERVLLWPQLARQAFVDDDFGRVRLLSFRPRKAAPRDQAHTDGRDVLVADIAGIRHRFLSALRHRLPFHAKRGHLDGLHGQTVRHRGRTRSWQLRHALQQAVHEGAALLGLGIAVAAQVDQHGQQMVAAKSRRDLHHGAQAANHQPGARQQNERERHFGHHQRPPDARGESAFARASAAAQRIVGILPGGKDSRRKPE